MVRLQAPTKGGGMGGGDCIGGGGDGGIPQYAVSTMSISFRVSSDLLLVCVRERSRARRGTRPHTYEHMYSTVVYFK